MSHIDSFKHSIVGYFLGIPVYLPLEEINGDFQCTPEQLLIGGGSGEHPALVVADPPAAVARFLDEEIDSLNLDRERRAAWTAAYESFVEWNHENILRFPGWTVETHHAFYERCIGARAVNPYSTYRHTKSLEAWLVLGFGEFVFFSLPRLAEEIVMNLTDPYECFRHVRYSNVLAVPPNMPVYANGGNTFFPKPRAS